MKWLQGTFIILVFGFLTACGDHGGHHVVAYQSDTPDLQGFYVVDSDGVSSELYPTEQSYIDPYVDAGFFEVYWYAQSFYDYNVYLSINDRPGVSGAYMLVSDYCGPSSHCDFDGSYSCQYTTDFELGCGLDGVEIDHNLISISDLFFDVPDTLYLNLEVCDEFDQYCQVHSRAVLMF